MQSKNYSFKRIVFKEVVCRDRLGAKDAKSLEGFADEAAEVLPKNEALLSRVPYARCLPVKVSMSMK